MMLDILLKVTHDLAVQVAEAEDGLNQRIDTLVKENGMLRLHARELEAKIRFSDNEGPRIVAESKGPDCRA